jgi:membrane protein DedA with SNARE-associated domain
VHQFTDFFLNLIHHAGYAGVFVVMTLANIGAPVGSEVVLPAVGLGVQKGALSNVWLAIAVAVLAELFGQSIGYAVGRFGGRPFIDRYGKYVRFHHAELDKVHGFFERYGKFAIFICRFVPVIRGIVGIPAGIAEMPLLPFYLWTLLGSLIFCGGLIWTGYALGAHANEAIDGARKYLFVIVGLIVVAAIAYFVVRGRRAQRSPS